jgi:hypothetical protein
MSHPTPWSGMNDTYTTVCGYFASGKAHVLWKLYTHSPLIMKMEAILQKKDIKISAGACHIQRIYQFEY